MNELIELQTIERDNAANKGEGWSESEEMYLITIAGLVEAGQPGRVALSSLAHELAIQPVSVNQMIHRLEEAGLVSYLPYKGVELTKNGEEVAARVLRRRRMWEVFLVKHLGLPDAEADALACRLEHVTPKNVVGRLADYLGHPSITPSGLPIPEANSQIPPISGWPVSETPAGGRVKVLALKGSKAARSFFAAQGIHPGIELAVLAGGEQGDRLVEVEGYQLHLTASIASQIVVVPPGREKPNE